MKSLAFHLYRCNGGLDWHWAFLCWKVWSSTTCRWPWRFYGKLKSWLLSLSKGWLPVIVVLLLSHICVISMIYGRGGHWERNLLKEEAKRGPWEKLECILLSHLSSRHLCSSNLLDMDPCIEPFVANSTSCNYLWFMTDHCTLNQVFWWSIEIVCRWHAGLLILMSSIMLGLGAIVSLLHFL